MEIKALAAFLFFCLASVAVAEKQNGEHYNLNLIGVPKDKTAPMARAGNVIFVKEHGNTKIELVPGTNFQVLDKNGTDRTGASFSMPSDVTSTYTVWVRALGKPNRSGTMTTCYTDATGETYCLGNMVSMVRKSGKPTVQDVSADLLNVEVCSEFDATGACVATTTIPLFSDLTLGYFWDYDNNGLKIAQLRFYPVQ